MPTPAEEGFIMPAEWEPHRRCWMAWPCRPAAWGGGLEEARDATAEVAREIVAFEPVTMVCNPGDAADVSLRCGRGVEVLPLAIDDSWTRDTGPTFVVGPGGEVAGVDWRFNGWGGKYLPYDEDARLASRILEHQSLRRFEAPLVLEGGAIHSDGQGTVLTTESCALNPNRNPGLSRDEVERHLKDYLGARAVIWLAGGLQDDETDGHVDNVACFARPGTVLALTTDDTTDGNHAVLQENLARLRAASDAGGRALEVVEVRQPARRERQGRRMALSYINFYFANGAVLMPAFGAPEDEPAFRTLRRLFPDRQVRQVLAGDVVAGGGGIHCITQQQPAAETANIGAGI